MDPLVLFPWLGLGLVAVAAWRAASAKRFDAAARTWAVLAVMFATIAIWLRWMR